MPHKDPIKKKVCDAAYRERNRIRLRQKHRNDHLKNRYGLTEEAVDALLASQGGRCAICSKEFVGTGKAGPHVDHKHDETQRVRGLLCHKCNVLIAYAEESSAILEAARRYLENWN